MRATFLNCWHGEVGEPLWNFLREESLKTDIFVLLEVSPEMLSPLEKVLFEFGGKYAQNSQKSGQAIFVKKNIRTFLIEKVGLYEQLPGDTGCLQKVKLELGGKKFLVGGVHGKAMPGDKLDTDVRLNQSSKIIKSFDFNGVPRIIGGDFNLLPETKSIKIFEEVGYKNLINEFGIKSTRNRLAWEQAEGQYKKEGRKFFGRQYFADYVFVSPEIKVKNFEVPDVEISDHLPLILDFEV